MRRGLAGLAPTTSLRLAQWYAGLAAGAVRRSKPLMLLRAKVYYERYLALHTAKDVAYLKAKVNVDAIAKELGEPVHIRYFLWLRQFLVTEPLHGIEALTGWNVPEVLDCVRSVFQQRGKRISTGRLRSPTSLRMTWSCW